MKIIMMRRMFWTMLILVGLVVLEGCTMRLGDFTVLSTKNVDVGVIKPGDRFAGEDCISLITPWIPLGEINWKNAMDRALEKGKGDVMIDAVVTYTGWTVILFGQQCVSIEGTVSQSPSFKR